MLLIVARAHANGPIAAGEETTAPSARARFRAWRRRRPFVGGLLTAIGGVEMFFSGQLDIGKIHVQLGIEGLQATIIPILLVLLGILVIAMPAHRIFYGVIALAVAVYSLVGVNLGGFFIGMLLSSIGGILTVAWMPKKAEVDAAGAEGDDDARAAASPAESPTVSPTASPAASSTEGTNA
ncbi:MULTISPECIES: DUF6114 domain-containing protein [unclassified Leifsonia]|uniref:DUF6114 domain-containing protein n=1 Tax=unclassified Leifsonia TaxID=2663824 RepID=UPI000373F2FD|nr:MULTISPECIES: DUF6114 domain-containing protein [unclassified Leifsonia]TDP99380.1 hypothetical protein AXZ95_3298 [Leifsonia sp. 115AMFTsu3.1]